MQGRSSETPAAPQAETPAAPPKRGMTEFLGNIWFFVITGLLNPKNKNKKTSEFFWFCFAPPPKRLMPRPWDWIVHRVALLVYLQISFWVGLRAPQANNLAGEEQKEKSSPSPWRVSIYIARKRKTMRGVVCS